MKKTLWIVLPLFLVLIIDQITKNMALNQLLMQSHEFKYWGLKLIRNPGIMFGTWADLPPILRVVSLSTLGSFILFIFIICQLLLSKNLFTLRVGMSLLVGGIMGNVIDRILSGSIIDFVYIKIGGFSSPIFNLADAFQWVGYAIICYYLLFKSTLIWPENNARKKVLINKSYQLRYTSIILVFSFLFSIILGVYSYTYLKVLSTQMLLKGFPEGQKYILPFMSIYAIVSLFFFILAVFLAIHLSHRSAGPVLAFENYLKRLSKGEDSEFKLRTNDEFKELEEIARELRIKFKEAHSVNHEQSGQILKALEPKNKAS